MIVNTNRITYHQLPETTTSSIDDSFESVHSHINHQDDWDNLRMVFESTVNTEIQEPKVPAIKAAALPTLLSPNQARNIIIKTDPNKL